MATIKLTNDVVISYDSLLLPQPDRNNQLATNNYNYTATQDCFVYMACSSGNTMYLTVDDVHRAYSVANGTGRGFSFFVRKGQVVKGVSTGGANMVAYGLK